MEKVEKESSSLKYVQVGAKIRELIHKGEFKAGDRLPSYAALYERFGATPATAQKVYDLLEKEKLVERRAGSGIYVAAPRSILTHNLGFIGNINVCKEPRTPYYIRLMDGIQQELERNRQQLHFLGNSATYDVAAFSSVDGVLMCNVEDPSPILRQMPAMLPRLSVLTFANGVESVGVDDYRGIQLAVSHLLSVGHTRIACLFEEFLSEGRRRLAGYRDALMQANIQAPSAWARLTETVFEETAPWKTEQPYREWAYAHMSAWLQDGWRETGCTAIVVQNEVAAIGVMQALQSEGLRVPEDVSVIGFDGTELCDLVSPRLTAVAVPLREIGVRAVEVLNRRIAGETALGQDHVFQLSLRPGESVAAPSVKS